MKLVQAATLAALLVPVGTVAEATPATCTTPEVGLPVCTGSASFSPTATFAEFDFDPDQDSSTDNGNPDYAVTLSFAQVNSSFTLDLEAIPRSQPDFASRLTNFPGFVCVAIFPEFPNGPCVEFDVTNAPSPSAYSGAYTIGFEWVANTNTEFPNDGGLIRVLHAYDNNPSPDSTTNPFTADITVPGTYFSGNPFDDPGVDGTDTSFSSFGVFEAPVPEPASLILLGTGIGGVLCRRRRRRNSSSA